MPGLPTTGSVIARNTWFDFHTLWNMGAEPEGYPGERSEVRLSYHRAVMMPYTETYAARLVSSIGIVDTSRVLVIGGGFGFLAEVLLGQYGVAEDRLVSQDASTYIVGARGETEEADIDAMIVGVGVSLSDEYGKEMKARWFDGSVRCRVRFTSARLENQSSANSVKSMFPSSGIDFVVTDDGYLNYHNDAQISDIFASLERLGAAQVWHIVYPNWGNAKSLVQFKAMNPSHHFVDYWSGQTV